MIKNIPDGTRTFVEAGTYREFSVAQEKAMKLKEFENWRSVRIDKHAKGWVISGVKP